jgi:tRNA (adenine58-N1)-methyltransferase non-catalytic subunit
MSNEEILNMRDNISDSKEIIGTLVANSKSFNEKTEYSQEKYIKKKEKKYFDYVQIRKPTIGLLADIFYRQDPDKPLGLRIDSLSQLISYSDVNSTGKYLLYESGSSGLVPAALLNSMGPSGDAQLVHLHPGNFPQKQAIFALNLEEEHMKKCVSVNIYSVLRQYYQGSGKEVEVPVVLEKLEENGDSRKRKAEDDIEEEASEAKKQHVESDVKDVPIVPPKEAKRPKWMYENDEAIEILKEKVDSLVIVSKEDPFSIVKELLPFVHPGRPVVIFHTCKEILMECYASMKSLERMINVRLLTSWMRNYQVLPMRTHPAVQITGTSGYLLVGYTMTNVKCE